MFWKRRGSGSSLLGGFLAKIFIVLAIIAIILLIAGFISWYILLAFLAVGVLIGLVYAIRSYIRGCITAKRSLISYTSAHTGKLAEIFDKVLYFNIETAKNAFIENKSVASNALSKAKILRVLSFKKWMWLIVALSVIVFGCIIIAGVVVLQFILLSLMIVPISLFLVIKYYERRKP